MDIDTRLINIKSKYVLQKIFDNVKEEDFLILVDYNAVKDDGERYPIRLVSYPDNVMNVRVNPKTVECIVEELAN